MMIKFRWSIEFDEKNVENVLRSFEILTSNVINCIGNSFEIFMIYLLKLQMNSKIAKTKYSSLKRDGLSLLEKIVKILKNGKLFHFIFI
jgi:hypothetical protein